MSLAEWQRDLAAAVAAPSGAAAASAHDGPGLALTRMLARNWRATRLRHALPLTTRALPAAGRDELLAAYCDACPCVSFFPAHEARSFAEFLAGRPGAAPHLASIAALEVAMIDAFEAEVFGDAATARPHAHGPLHLARGATRVRFAGPPERVLAAALAGLEPPPAGAEHELLVAPGVVRPPSAAEREALDACADGRPPPADAAATLLADGVLAVVDPYAYST
ncbi:MAG: hypothetical protein JNL82_40695 [Myxococcales bacterium]|nr:hypothetical protein [Myxococcales bacterium]